MSNLSRKDREKLQRQTEILDAAEKIFARDGFEHASMNEIAKESEFTKRTLYQYFEDKSDLYLSVALRLYNSMSDNMKSLNPRGNNGFEKLRECFVDYYNFYKENEDKFRIIYDIGNVRKVSENPKIQEFLKIDQYMFMHLNNLVAEGQKDGSISYKSDALTITSSLLFLFTGFLNQVTISGNNYAKHLGITTDNLFSNVLDIICSSLA